MTQLYIIRHAAYNPTEKMPFDPDLSPAGIDQVERLRNRLAATKEIKADILISSPLLRAHQTAEIIAPALNLPIKFEPELEEWRNSEGHTLPFEEFQKELMATPHAQKPYYQPRPGVESWAQFGLRACFALNRICLEYAGKTIVIVAHGGIVEASFLFAYGFSPLQPSPIMMMLDPAYTSITHWRKINEVYGWRLEQYNDIMHLRDDIPFRQPQKKVTA